MKPTAEALMNAELDRLIKEGLLESWNSFVEALNVPNDLFPALMSNRAALVKLVTPRALTADEHRVYLDLIAALMETNRALRQHASDLAHLTGNWAQAFKALRSIGHRIEAFAQFKNSTQDEEEDS